ncbi:hypothetical protein CONPUDRAFT_47764, partial [Coniophora puteana RWD-64-598 SS2]
MQEIEDDHGLRWICNPFWEMLPHSDIFKYLTPNILHQLHKGMFKDHFMTWFLHNNLLGKDGLDAWYQSMTLFNDLRHFKKGISVVSQWTGTEHKEMECTFVGALSGLGLDSDVLAAARALLNFITLAQYESYTDKPLAAMTKSLHEFHRRKDVFSHLDVQHTFNIPKLHAMLHYIESIELFGSADGFNTESPEHLHIDFAKCAYRASNKQDYLIQMTTWLHQQEALLMRTSYLDWLQS